LELRNILRQRDPSKELLVHGDELIPELQSTEKAKRRRARNEGHCTTPAPLNWEERTMGIAPIVNRKATVRAKLVLAASDFFGLWRTRLSSGVRKIVQRGGDCADRGLILICACIHAQWLRPIWPSAM
jgi:hypothetical protein